MKLLNYTTTYFAGILLVLISVWAIVFYYAMFEEIYDSIDDGLDNRKMVLIALANKDLPLMDKPQLDEYLYTIEPVDYNNYRGFRDIYKDTLMYMVNEEEFEPVRMLKSIFKKNNDFYKITVVTSMIEEDDQIRNLLKYTILLYLALIISILLLNKFFLRKVWKPFYKLIDQLKVYRLERNETIRYRETNIEEFALLNESIEKLLQKTRQSYSDQKQFIENASHELQTPLAIAINKLELLFEDDTLTDSQAKQLQHVLENLERLTRLNRSLLLISKIENDQFPLREEVDLQRVIEKIISDYSDMAAHKNMNIGFVAERTVKTINPDLTYILFSNLIKNAISHGKSGSTISLRLTDYEFLISNNSTMGPLQDKAIFERFQKMGANTTSTGLGLSIAKSIAEQFGFTLKYHFENGLHTFTLRFI